MSSIAVSRAFAVTFSVLLVTSTVAFGGAFGVVAADHDGSGTSASISVTPSVPKGIDATDFDTDSYIVTNTGTTDITRVVFDLRGALLPDSVFDPVGTAVGDTAGKCFTADSGAAATGLVTDGSLTTAPCLDPFSGAHNGDLDEGYDLLTIEFSDFNPGETFTFSADIDPTSITGSVPPGPADSSSLSGLELTGSVVTVTGADGATVSGVLFADGSDSGAETIAIDTPAPAPTIAVDGVALDATTLSPAHRAAETAAFDHTIVVTGAPAGATVRLLQAEAGLYVDGVPSGGFDLERYEANRVLSQSVLTATADGSGTATFAVTLDASVPEGGYNHFVAVYDDGVGHTSRTSDVVVLQYDANAGVNDAPVIDPVGSRLVQTDATLDIAVSATDAEFDPISLSTSGLPAFGTFTDNGDGTGLLSLSPTASDVGVYPIVVAASDGQASSTETVSVTVTEAKTGTVAYRVNAGGSQIAASGPDWEADTGTTSPYRNSGSSTSFWGSTVSATTSAVPADTPSAIWQSARWDPISGFAGAEDPEMEWNFDVPAGTLTEVRLYFAEGFSGASEVGQRIFDVTIDGDLALDNYDIVADAGYATGTMKSFTVVSDGTVDVDFGHEFQNPVVSAIEIVTFEADPGELGAVPTSVDFGTVVVGSSASVTVTLTNLGQTGDPAVTVAGASVSGANPSQFDATLTGPATVAPGESTTVEVTFAPGSEGTRTATLGVAHDGSNSPVLVGLLAEASASSPVSFTPAGVDVPVEFPTSLQWGPDGRLYVSEQFGRILALTIERTGPAAYTVTDTEVITAVQNLPNHDDDGTPNPGLTTRQVTGLLVTGTAAQPVLYVTSSDPRIGGQSSGLDLNLDTNSGILSRLTLTSGGWEHVQLVRGLPRSEENHAPNGMALDPATDTLYLAQGGNTGQGAPSKQLGYLSEFAYAAAILEIDLAAIEALPVVDGVAYDLPTLQGSAEPFGGQDGLNQAVITPDSPVQVYSPGYRNPYDVVLTESGRLYTSDNGGSGGWGDVPVGEGTAGVCTNAPNDGGLDKVDQFHLVTEGFYAGHPNPTRANPDGAGIYSDDGTLLLDFTAGNTPVPFDMANPIECDARDAGEDGSLTSFADSTNGLAEYTASNFGGAMQGDILAASFTTGGPIWRLSLNAAGDQLTQKEGLLANFGSLPLDVTAVGDDGLFPGTIWAVTYGAETLVVFEPVDYDGATTTCTGADDPALDEDGDGFSNADEIAAGTNPCSAGSKPADFDGDGVSDVTDTDDDNDGRPDTTDPFPIDPDDGKATTLPVHYTFEVGAEPNTLFDMGFTGLMTNGVDYLALFEETGVSAGGIAGVFTLQTAEDGTADGPSNDQRYAFQFGVAPEGPFTANTTLDGPFPAGDAAVDDQAAGVYVGTGDQDNFVAARVVANGGQGGVELVREVDGQHTVVATVTDPGVVGPTQIDLRLRVDPATGVVTGSYVVGGTETTIGATTVPSTWFGANTGTAVGLLATSAGPAEPFAATFDDVGVTPETAQPDPGTVLYRVNAGGGPLSVADGPNWQRDDDDLSTAFHTAPTRSSNYPGAVTGTDATVPAGTPRAMFDSARWDLPTTPTLDWYFDVPVGTPVEVRLYFAERWDGAATPGARVFDVLLEGQVVLDDFDVVSQAGFTTGTMRSFQTVSDGTLDIGFRHVVENPLVTGIEIVALGDSAPVNRPPTFTNAPALTVTEGATGGVTIDATDADNDPLTLTASGVPAFATFSDNGDGTATLTAAPGTGDAGSYTVTVTADDGQATATETVVLTVSEATTGNSAPTITSAPDLTVTEGASGSVPVTASDPDSDPLTLTASGLPAFATFTDAGDGTGTLSASPGSATAGSYTVTVTASDGQESVTGTLTLTVQAPPAPGGTVYHRINVGGPSLSAPAGPAWSDDTALTSPLRVGGERQSNYGTAVTAHDGTVPNAVPQSLFQYARWDQVGGSEMAWGLPVPAGTPVEVRLYFAEGWDGASTPGVRQVDVLLDGALVLNDFDITAEAGFRTGTMRSFRTTSDGTVDIDFRRVVQNPLLSGIEVVGVDSPPANQAPIARASASPSSVLVGSPVTFDARASSDIDGSVQSYAWDFDRDGTTDATGAVVSTTFASAGTKTVVLTVTDDDGATATATATVTVTDPASSPVLYRVNAGGSELPASDGGPAWSADSGTSSAYRPTDGTRVSTSSATISAKDGTVPANTPIDVFKSSRWDPAGGSPLTYTFPVPAGTTVDVRLYFADGYVGTSQPGQRVFDVFVGGSLALDDFDIVGEAGFKTGTMRTVSVTSDGAVAVRLAHVVENPTISGIEIVRVDDTAASGA